MKIIRVGDRVRLVMVDGNIPSHLHDSIAEVLAVHVYPEPSFTGRVNGDPIHLPMSAIGKVIGHEIGKAEV